MRSVIKCECNGAVPRLLEDGIDQRLLSAAVVPLGQVAAAVGILRRWSRLDVVHTTLALKSADVTNKQSR